MTFIEDFKRPFNIFTVLIAIASLVIAIYFYYNPRRNKTISYTFSEPSLIYDISKASPKISLLDSQKKPITDNVYVAEFTIWNSGAEPIEPSDARKPLLLKITNGLQILDATIKKQTDETVSSFVLSPIETNISEKILRIDWKHFDPNQGVTFQVIFSAARNYTIGFDYQIVGLEKFSDARPMTKRSKWIELLAVVILTVTASFSLDRIKDFWRRYSGWRRYGLITTTIIVAGIIAVVVFNLFLIGERPPL